MLADLYPSDEYASEEGASSRPSHPVDVLLDPRMPLEAKRALLAGWASDLRAVENQPALRRLDDGTLLHIDDILDALKALDSSTEPAKVSESVLAFPLNPSRFRSGFGRHEDDDPPPRPVAQRIPRRRRAQGVQAWYRGGAYAAA
jgi:hypothetical protein